MAVEFMERGWSIKELHRAIVTCRTYQQSSVASADALAKDPTNRLLTRGPRVRLEAEQIRDLFLSVSGLLSENLGGPSVFPPQPRGVTSEGAYGPLDWNVSKGGDQYRRSLYTFAKRTAPYAMFTTFDAGSGEACLARREISNTPLQSLTLLNDTLTLDTARSLGMRLVRHPGSTEEKIDRLYRLCLGRPPQTDEKDAIIKFLDLQRLRLNSIPGAAERIGGSNQVDESIWTLAARALLNLDETITKE